MLKFQLMLHNDAIFSTNDEKEMASYMRGEIEKNHERFVDMILLVDNNVVPKTIFLMKN